MSDFWSKVLGSTEEQKEQKPLKSSKSKSSKLKGSQRDTLAKLDCKGLEVVLYRKGARMNIKKLEELKLCKKLIRHFTLRICQMGEYIQKVTNHKRKTAAGEIIFPRFGMLKYIEENLCNVKIINKIGEGNPPSVPYKWTGEFRNNQVIIAKHILANVFDAASVKAGKAGLILNLEAGQGKSFLATGLFETLQICGLVVCHNSTILDQWVKILKAAYPNNKIGRYYGQHKEDGDIVVAIINSLIMSDFKFNGKTMTPQQYFKKFGFVILDEVHEYSSPQRKLIYNRAQSKYMIGLSATPDEKDFNLDNINVWNCGEILDATTLDGYSVEDIPFKGEVTMVKYFGAPEYIKVLMNESVDVINHAGMVNQICEDPYRLHVIMKILFKLRKEGKNVYVFTDRRVYLTKIKEAMAYYKIATHELLSPEDEAKVSQLMGGSSAAEVSNAKNNSNIILTTYPYMGTGCSIPKMDALILATPRKKKSKQFVGRIFRLGSDYSITRKIYDIVDWNTHMKSQWYMRNRYYKEKGYPVSDEWHDWKDVKKEMIELGLHVDKPKAKTCTQSELDKLEALITSGNF